MPDPQVFDYVLGSKVSNGVPAAGAGNSETIASLDRYRFQVTKAGDFQLDQLSGMFDYRVVNAQSGEMAASGYQDKAVSLPVGSYYLEYGVDDYDRGAYSFSFESRDTP